MSELIKRPVGAAPAPTRWEPREPPAAVPPDDPRTEVRRLLRVLWAQKRLILGITAALVLPAAVGTYLVEPLYRSTALIEVKPEPVQVLPYRDVTDVSNVTPHFEIYMKTQEQVLRSPTLVAEVGQRLRAETTQADVQQEATRVGARVGVKRIENSQLFEVSYLAPRPEVAAKVANVFAEEYIKRHFRSRQSMREDARQMLERELSALAKRVQVSERELVGYAQDNRMLTTSDPKQGSLVQQKLALLAQELTTAETEAVGARSRLSALQSASVDEFPERLITPVIASRLSGLLQLEQELTSLRASYGENWPAVVQKRGEIELVRRQIATEKAAVLDQAREQAALDLRTVEARRKMLATSFDDQERLVNQFQSASIQYNILEREVETNKKLYEGLLERLRQTSVTPGMEFGNLHVIEPARPSGRPAVPNWLLNLSVAAALGLALGICLVFVRDYWDRSLKTPADVEFVASLPVLGTLPVFEDRPRPALHRHKGQRARRTLPQSKPIGLLVPPAASSQETRSDRKEDEPVLRESVRNICASILLSRSGHPPRRLMVTSSVPGEGKTTVVRLVGRALAEGGATALLVECDLRKATLSASYGINGEGGLSLFLAGHGGPPKIHATDHDNLFVVGAGPTPPNPVALLNSERLQSFLVDASDRHQFVIVDAPPVLPVADARFLGSMVDGVILVVRAGATAREQLLRAKAIIEASGANLLGVVLNGAAAQHGDDSYYSYYGYYGES